MDSYETEEAIEFHDGYGLLHNTNGPALIKGNYEEFFEHGIWQKTICSKIGLYQVPTNTPTFEDQYGTRHYFRDNLHHGCPSIETLSGVKCYHVDGVLISQLMPDDSLYYDYQDNVPSKYTDKTGTTYKKTPAGWQTDIKYMPGKRASIKIKENNIVEEWIDPFGTRYTFKNGIISSMHNVNGAIIEFPTGNTGFQILNNKDNNIISLQSSIDCDNDIWEYINHYETKITTPKGTIIETYCSKIVKTHTIVLNGSLKSGHISRVSMNEPYLTWSVLDQIKPYIPNDQQKWFNHMEPIFKEYQLNDEITNILNASMSDMEFLKKATPNEVQAYAKQLALEFYDDFRKAFRVGQALRLFKHYPQELDSFAVVVQKSRSDLLLYCCQTLFENNPDHIKLLCEVKW